MQVKKMWECSQLIATRGRRIIQTLRQKGGKKSDNYQWEFFEMILACGSNETPYECCVLSWHQTFV